MFLEWLKQEVISQTSFSPEATAYDLTGLTNWNEIKILSFPEESKFIHVISAVSERKLHSHETRNDYGNEVITRIRHGIRFEGNEISENKLLINLKQLGDDIFINTLIKFFYWRIIDMFPITSETRFYKNGEIPTAQWNERELVQSIPPTTEADEGPKVPSKFIDFQNWKKVWRIIKPQWKKEGSLSKISRWMDKTHPSLPHSVRTLRKIVEAGEAGKLD